MRLIEFLIDEYDAPCTVIGASTLTLIEDIKKQMMEIFPDKNVRDLKFIGGNENSFEENFVF
jgi:hypothetical protein